jgi:hypothetical protein
MRRFVEQFINAKRRPAAERDADDAEILASLSRRAGEIEARDTLTRGRALALTLARDENFLGQLIAAIGKVSKDKLVVPRYQAKKKAKTQRVLNLLWSDLHFHSLLDPREVPVGFGPVEEARRLAALCVQAAEYKRDHRDETSLVINLAGDIIQGLLGHDPRDGAPLAEQVAAALFLLKQAIGFLAGEFKLVEVNCVPGNHGRNIARHQGRATHQKWDSVENMLYSALKVAFMDVPNVRFNIPYTPYVVYDVFDKKVFVTHGDTVLKPGNPSSSIDVKSIRSQINEFNAVRKDKDKVSLFAVGHVHTASLVHLAGGVMFMSNGALVPVDPFAQSVGVFDTTCGQQMWESVPGRVVGDTRFVVVDETTDKDKALDKIIRPFTGF